MSSTSAAVGASGLVGWWKFEHAAIRVADFEKAVAWYTETLGFRLMERGVALGDKTFGFLAQSEGGGGLSIELIAGAAAESRPAYEDLGSSFELFGLHHLGFRVGSVDETVAELRARGVKIVSEPHDVAKLGLRVAFFADPWGNLFEVIQALGA